MRLRGEERSQRSVRAGRKRVPKGDALKFFNNSRGSCSGCQGIWNLREVGIKDEAGRLKLCVVCHSLMAARKGGDEQWQVG